MSSSPTTSQQTDIANWLATVHNELYTPTSVQYGDTVRLSTFNGSPANLNLHSHGLNYIHTGTSGQQQITGFGADDDNDWWIISSAENKSGNVKCGDRIILKHLLSNLYLHSHTSADVAATNGADSSIKSPDPSKREITCYADDPLQNLGSTWYLDVYNNGTPAAIGSVWQPGAYIALRRYNPNIGKPGYNSNYAEYVWISSSLFPLGNGDSQYIAALNSIPTFLAVKTIKQNNFIYRFTAMGSVPTFTLSAEAITILSRLECHYYKHQDTKYFQDFGVDRRHNKLFLV